MSLPAKEIKATSHVYDNVTVVQLLEVTNREKDPSDGIENAQEPTEWPTWYKWMTVALVATMNTLEYIQYWQHLFDRRVG